MYALTGIDTVISTVSGTSQLALIEAAVRCGCRRFVPSEFSGPPARRPLEDAIESAKTETLDRLRYYAGQIESTVFVCGIFYERFAPGGMGALGLGLGSGISGEGDYVLDMRNFHAEIPSHDREGREVHVSMTSAQDVARFVVRALDFAHWPLELWMQGDRMSVWNLVMEAEAIRGL